MRNKGWMSALIRMSMVLAVGGIIVGVFEKASGAEIATKITVDVSPDIEIIEVKPHMDIAAGKTTGRMVVEVTLRNKGMVPQRFIIFANGIIEGGQLGGRTTIPAKGKLEPNEVAKAKITTTYVGAVLPQEVIVEAGPCLVGPGCE